VAAVVAESKRGLDKLVESISFSREQLLLYTLPGLFLILSLPQLAAVLYYAMTGNMEAANKFLTTWYSRLAVLYTGYIILSSYLSYRLTKLSVKHLVDSGIVSYYWFKQRGDEEAVKALYRSGLMRRELPSPVTALIITLLTGGLAYLAVLYIVEKNLRDHCYGEEASFIGVASTNRIDPTHLLLDIAATLLTLGLYLSIWSARVVRVYNKHLALVHGKHPNPPEPRPVSGDVATTAPILLLGIALLHAAVAGALGAIKLPLHAVTIIGYSSMLAGFMLKLRDKPLLLQVAATLVLVYFTMLLTTAVGFMATPAYTELTRVFRRLDEIFKDKSFWDKAAFIFANNYALALASLTPFIGPILLGWGMGQAAVYIGVATTISIARGWEPAVIIYALPYAVLELLGYSIFLALSTRITGMKPSRALAVLAAGTLILFLAALEEARLVTPPRG